jgi:hypothetical protein
VKGPRGHRSGRAALVSAAAALTATVLTTTVAGCSSSGSEAPPPPAARLERTGHGLSVVLTPLGALRIALRTEHARTGPGGQPTVPYDALVYEPSGEPAVYVATRSLTFTRYLVPATKIVGQTVYLKPGSLPANSIVVTQGAEELLGVQNGIGEET